MGVNCGGGDWWLAGGGYVVFLAEISDQGSWSAVISQSWEPHEHGVLLLVLQGHKRISEVAVELCEGEAPSLANVLGPHELVVGLTIPVDMGDRAGVMVASVGPLAAGPPFLSMASS